MNFSNPFSENFNYDDIFHQDGDSNYDPFNLRGFSIFNENGEYI